MPESAIVRIWMPTGIFTSLGVGHAAIRLETATGKQRYITWSAQGNPLKAPFKFQNSPRYAGLETFTYDQDKRCMRGFFGAEEPHHTIDLPILRWTQPGLTYGVSTNRISKFWKQQKNESTYAFFSARYNCTGCVWEALKAGGLNYYHDIDDSVFIQGAAGLLEAVKKAKANIDKLNRSRLSIEMLMADLRYKYPAALQSIPTIAQWKTASDKNVRFRAVAARKEQIAALDKLIKDYPNAKTVEEKYVLLFTMQREIHSHIKKKADSDRREAVERLGATVSSVLRNLPVPDLQQLSERQYSWVMNTLGWRGMKLA